MGDCLCIYNHIYIKYLAYDIRHYIPITALASVVEECAITEFLRPKQHLEDHPRILGHGQRLHSLSCVNR